MIRAGAGHVLARYAAGLTADCGTLRRALASADEHLAAAAGYLLTTRWGDCEEVLPFLLDAAAGGDHAVRLWALTALAANWREHPSTMPLLLDALKDGCPGIREAAMEALSPLGYDILDSSLLDALSRDSDVLVRYTARGTLAARNFNTGFSDEFLDSALHGEDSNLDRLWAVKALCPWRFDDPAAVNIVDGVVNVEDLPSYYRQWAHWQHQRLDG